jgi:hypothetical protein
MITKSEQNLARARAPGVGVCARVKETTRQHGRAGQRYDLEDLAGARGLAGAWRRPRANQLRHIIGIMNISSIMIGSSSGIRVHDDYN